MWSQLRDFLLKNKVCPPILQQNFGKNLFNSLNTGSLVIFDINNEAALATSVLHGIRSGTMKPMAVLPIIDTGTFVSKLSLTSMNMTIR